MKLVEEDFSFSGSQVVVTNRVIREVILHVGLLKLLSDGGRLDVGDIEDFCDITKAVRS